MPVLGVRCLSCAGDVVALGWGHCARALPGTLCNGIRLGTLHPGTL